MTTIVPTHIPTAGAPYVPALAGFFDDFMTAGVSGTADAARWLLTGASATAVIKNSSRATDLLAGPGVLTLSSDTTNPASLQLNGEPYRLTPGKRLWGGCRLALNSVASTQLWMGLSLEDATILAGAPSDYLGFRNVDADNKIHAASAKNSSATTNDTGKTWGTTDSVFKNLTFEYDGKNRVTYFVDGDRVHQSLVQLQENNDNIPDDEDLTFGIEILGSAGKSVEVDFAYCLIQR